MGVVEIIFFNFVALFSFKTTKGTLLNKKKLDNK